MSMVEMKSDSFLLTIVFFNLPLTILVTVLHESVVLVCKLLIALRRKACYVCVNVLLVAHLGYGEPAFIVHSEKM